MQTLPTMQFDQTEDTPRLINRLSNFVQKIVQALNHNAQETEPTWTMETPANGTYAILIPHVPRKVIAVYAELIAGTCTAVVTHGATSIAWKTAAGTSLSVSTTVLYDTATSGNEIMPGTLLTVVLSAVAGASGLAITLRTGS